MSNVRGPGRTTREDWLEAALQTLISEGVNEVKILTLAGKLDCARSSFYWYFKNRSELLDALLEIWATKNTRAIISAAKVPADSINFALAQLYVEWLSGEKFDVSLDFAIRDWAKHSEPVKQLVIIGDTTRMNAIASMFIRHDYKPDEANIRARIVYLTQIGYSTMDQRETWEQRSSRAELYLQCMTGIEPSDKEIDSIINPVKQTKKSSTMMLSSLDSNC